MRIRVLSADDITNSVNHSDVIDANERAFVSVSNKTAVQPQRLPVKTDEGTMLLMPAYMRTENALAIKTVTIYPNNPQIGFPTSQALMMVIDSNSGSPVALMDGTRLTALRTGAAGAVAVRHLAREDARVVGLFGAGGQAMDQIESLLVVRPIEEVRIFTPSGHSANHLADRINKKYPALTVHVVDTPREGALNADIVVCVTTSYSPVFDPADISPGTHINGLGSYLPEMSEVSVNGYSNPVHIFVDSIEAVMTEAGEIIDAVEKGHLKVSDLTEIGQIITGHAKGRTHPEQFTFFKSVGVAVQDAVTAKLVLDQSVQLNLGTEIEI